MSVCLHATMHVKVCMCISACGYVSKCVCMQICLYVWIILVGIMECSGVAVSNLRLVTGELEVRIYLKPLGSDHGHDVHPQ